MTITYKHSGDLGDIIYSLPVIKTNFEKTGNKGCYLLDITGGEDEIVCQKQCIDGKTKFSRLEFDFIKPLIEIQPYIEEVKIYSQDDKVDINFNEFRKKFSDPNSRSKYKNLLDLHMESCGLDEYNSNDPWLLNIDPVKQERKVCIARSPRMTVNFSFHQMNKFYYRDNAFFIGLDKEHELFEWTFGIKIPHKKVIDSVGLARLIIGTDLFIGNPSCPLAIAIGVGHKNILQEVDPKVPTTVFEDRIGMRYV